MMWHCPACLMEYDEPFCPCCGANLMRPGPRLSDEQRLMDELAEADHYDIQREFK